MNYYGDLPEHGPPADQSKNVIKVLLIVFIAIFVSFIFVCGGIITLGYFGFQAAQREMQKQFAQVEMSAEMQDFYYFSNEGDYAAALESIDQVIQNDPRNSTAHNNKAWLLATCPVDRFRDGAKSLEHAELACELSEYENYMFVDTLAAAHAELGNFDEAVRWQKEAVQLVPAEIGDAVGVQERLDLYESGQPYRELAVPDANVPEPGDMAPASELERSA